MGHLGVNVTATLPASLDEPCIVGLKLGGGGPLDALNGFLKDRSTKKASTPPHVTM